MATNILNAKILAELLPIDILMLIFERLPDCIRELSKGKCKKEIKMRCGSFYFGKGPFANSRQTE